MKKLLLSLVLLTTLTGCGSSSDATTEDAATSDVATTDTASDDATTDTEGDTETEDTADSSAGGENVTGGAEVEKVEESDLMITDTDGGNLLDANKDDTEDTLDNSGFEYTVKVYDTDGDGIISDENDTNEQFTTVISLKNTSGHDIEMSDFQIYLQSSYEDLPIDIVSIDTGDMDTDKFILGEEHYENYIRYIDEDTYDQFTFPKDNEINITLTSTVSVALDTIEPAELTFVALNEDGVSYYIESTSQFAAM